MGTAIATPWHVESAVQSDAREIHSADGWHLFTVQPSGTDVDVSDVSRLIAAAPELLEALREAERVIRYAAQESAGRVKQEIVGGWRHHANKIRAAIAKAEGR